MENKVYVIVTTKYDKYDDCKEMKVEKVFADRAAAERFAKQLEKEYTTEFSIVPEDIFLRWPMDNICNSPVSHYEGYSYADYKAQERRCDYDYSPYPVYCRVEEHTLS